MKKVIIALSEIRDYNDAELLATHLACSLQDLGMQVSLFCQNITGNESTDRMQPKGIRMNSKDHSLPIELPKECDVLIALDEWAVENSTGIESKMKMKMSKKQDPVSAVKIVLMNIEKNDKIKTKKK